MTNCLVSIPLVGLLAAVTAIVAVAGEPPDDNSPLGGVEPQELTVTAIKQTATADNQAAAATTITAREAEALNIVDARTASAKAPNFFIPDYGSRMTSTIYVRGLGARIDQPVVGLNVDNVPIMNKDNYDYPISWDTRELTLGSEFTSRNHGLALYHQSSCKLGRWNITAGVRVDYEHAALDYVSSCETGYDVIDASDGSLYKHFDVNLNESGHLSKSFWEVLPKVAVTYNASNNSRVYISAARGYKAGGFNTQMFSDVLQQRLMYSMGIGYEYDVDDVVTYKPEHSWTFEGGGNAPRVAQRRSASRRHTVLHLVHRPAANHVPRRNHHRPGDDQRREDAKLRGRDSPQLQAHKKHRDWSKLRPYKRPVRRI